MRTSVDILWTGCCIWHELNLRLYSVQITEVPRYCLNGDTNFDICVYLLSTSDLWTLQRFLFSFLQPTAVPPEPTRLGWIPCPSSDSFQRSAKQEDRHHSQPQGLCCFWTLICLQWWNVADLSTIVPSATCGSVWSTHNAVGLWLISRRFVSRTLDTRAVLKYRLQSDLTFWSCALKISVNAFAFWYSWTEHTRVCRHWERKRSSQWKSRKKGRTCLKVKVFWFFQIYPSFWARPF